MKYVIAAIAVISLTASVNAGTLVFEAEEEQEIVIVEDEPMGGAQQAVLPSNKVATSLTTKTQLASGRNSCR